MLQISIIRTSAPLSSMMVFNTMNVKSISILVKIALSHFLCKHLKSSVTPLISDQLLIRPRCVSCKHENSQLFVVQM